MRLFALYGLLAVVLGPLQCERRNPSVCDRSDFPDCEAGYSCQIEATESVGRCVPTECSANSKSCPAERPFCSGGRCVLSCTSDAQCVATNLKTPVCSGGGCVACRDNSTCSDPLHPVCETSTHSCRACAAHGECPSGVCAKDDTFATLASPIVKGTCVPSERVQTVDESDCKVMGNVCSLPYKVSLASKEQPFLLLRHTGEEKKIDLLSLPVGLPELYVIGPLADSGPAVSSGKPPEILLSNPATSAVRVRAGTAITLEGVLIAGNGMYGIECDSDKAGIPVATRVRLLRSLIGGSSIAISAKPRCELFIEQSWIGRGPSPEYDGLVRSNDKAMQLDSTSLQMSSSVLWKNGKLGSVFGGISLTDSKPPTPPSRIVSSTLVEHDFADVRKALVLDCNPGGKLSLVNNLFMNGPPLGASTYVHKDCLTGNLFTGNASNDPALGAATNFTDATDAMFVMSGSGDLRLRADAPVSVRTQAVLSAADAQGPVPLPATDIAGQPRGQSLRSIGAFAAPR